MNLTGSPSTPIMFFSEVHLISTGWNAALLPRNTTTCNTYNTLLQECWCYNIETTDSNKQGKSSGIIIIHGDSIC